MTTEMMYDPPTGWRYGFPKVYRPVEGETVEDTLVRDGYPRAMADDFGGKHCRFWYVEPPVETPIRSWDSIARRYVEHDTTSQETFGKLPEGWATMAEVKAELGFPPANDNQYDPNARFGDFIQTVTGKQFWPMDPRASDVDILDVAHALSMQTRYAGHCLRFYSVAEHSVLIANWIWWHGSTADALCGLLHDATEAYLCDVPRPVKPHLVGYKAAEENVWVKAIAPAFNLPIAIPAVVHEADSRILLDERAQNMSKATYVGGWPTADPLGVELQFWSPAEAEANFLATFERLQKMGVAA